MQKEKKNLRCKLFGHKFGDSSPVFVYAKEVGPKIPVIEGFSIQVHKCERCENYISHAALYFNKEDRELISVKNQMRLQVGKKPPSKV